MRKTSFVLVILAILLLTLPISASDTSNATYYGTILVSNNGTAASAVATNCTISTSNLINGYINDILEFMTVIDKDGNDVPYMPGYDTNPWCFWIDSADANSNQEMKLYTNSSTNLLDNWSFEYGDPPDDWSFTNNGGSFVHSVNATHGDWAAAITRNGTNEYINQTASVLPSWYGANITFGVNVYNTESSTVSISLIGDVSGYTNSNYHTGSGWEYLTVTKAITADTSLSARIRLINIDTTIYCDESIMVVGDELPDIYYNPWDDNKAYFPGSGGMVTSDAAGLEYGNFFGWEYSGYVDTSGTGNLTRKDGAFWCGFTAPGELTAQVYGTSASVVDTGVNNGEHVIEVYTGQSSEGLDEYYNETENASSGKYTYGIQIEAQTFYTDIEFTPTKIKMYGKKSSGDTGNLYISIKETTGGYHYPTGDDLTTATLDVATDLSTSFSWMEGTFDNSYKLDADTWYSVYTYYPDGSWPDSYVVYSYDNVTPGAHEGLCATSTDNGSSWGHVDNDLLFEIYGTTATLELDIDGVNQDSCDFESLSVPNTVNDWVDGDPDVTPYIEYVKRYVDGELVQHVKYEYDSTFTDLSGNGNDATPNFRTTTSDADVTAELIEFQPFTTAQAPSSSVNLEGRMVDEMPEMPDTMYSENTSPGIFFAPLVNAIMDAASFPRTLFWYPFGLIIAILAGALTFRYTRSLIMQASVEGGFIILFALPGINIYGMWVFVFWAFEALAVIIMSKHFSW